MYSERIFNVRPDSKIGASFASVPSVRLFPPTARGPMPPLLTAGTTSSAKTNIISYLPYLVTWMYCLAAYNCWSGKSEWLKKKPELHWHLAAQILRQPPPKQPPEACGYSAG